LFFAIRRQSQPVEEIDNFGVNSVGRMSQLIEPAPMKFMASISPPGEASLAFSAGTISVRLGFFGGRCQEKPAVRL
jgi:hypothetical protein